MYNRHGYFTAHTILPLEAPCATTRPRGRRRRRRHVPHAQRPADVVDRRNARERRRVNDVNAAFLELQVHLPSSTSQDEQTTPSPSSSSSSDLTNGHKRLSKIKILHDAIDYIAQLTSILNLSAYTANTGSGPGNTPEVPLDHPPGGYGAEFLQAGDWGHQGQVEETGFCSRVLVCNGGRMPLQSSTGEHEDRWSSTPTNQYWFNSQDVSSSWIQQSSTQMEESYNRWKTDYVNVDTPYLVIQPNNSM